MNSRHLLRSTFALAVVALIVAAAASRAGAATASPAPTAKPAASAAKTPATATVKTATPAAKPAAVTAKAPTSAARPAPAATQAPAPGAKPAPAAESGAEKKDDGMTLKAGEEGTVFRTLTIEGEDRIRLDFARPQLEPQLDFDSAPGLGLARAPDVLARSAPDPMDPLLARTALDPSPYVARPWLSSIASGPVVRIRPQVDDVERWKLSLTDSRGQVVAVREGRGRPPAEIAWNGLSDQGRPVVPGLTYSHLFEAWDRAGNRRRFVGEGFRVSACRIDTPKGVALALGGAGIGAPGTAPSLLLLEAASWAAQLEPQRALRITATARTRERAEQLGAAAIAVLTASTPGAPARLQPVHEVLPDAPEAGALRIEPVP